MPALLPTGSCPSSQLLHTFLYELHLFHKRPLSVLSPRGPRFLFCFASCMDFLQSLTANSLPPTSAFSVCLSRAAQMPLYMHTHTQTHTRCRFPSALRWAQLLTIAAFFSCKSCHQLPTVLPTFLFNSHSLARFVFRTRGVDRERVERWHFLGWDVSGCG